MARSLKKGYFIDDHLVEKVTAMNERGDRRVIKTARLAAGDYYFWAVEVGKQGS